MKMYGRTLRSYRIAGLRLLAIFIGLASLPQAFSQTSVTFVPTVNAVADLTHAGPTSTPGASGGFVGDGAPGTLAVIGQVNEMMTDAQGNIYFPDQTNNAVRRVDARTGVITTIAGTGTACTSTSAQATSDPCGDNGPALAATMYQPQAVALDSQGFLYVADTLDYRVRAINLTGATVGNEASGNIFTVLGNGRGGTPANGNAQYAGTVSNSAGSFTSAVAPYVPRPYQMTIDKNGNLYISTNYTSGGSAELIMEVSPPAGFTSIGAAIASGKSATVTVISGTASSAAVPTVGASAGDGGTAANATWALPWGIAVDSYGNIYVADRSLCRVRMIQVNNGNKIISLSGSMTSGACATTGFTDPSVSTTGVASPQPATNGGTVWAVALDADQNLYFGDNKWSQIFKLPVVTAGPTPTFSSQLYLAVGGSSAAYSDAGLGVVPTPGTTAMYVDSPLGVLIDPYQNMVFSDASTAVEDLRKVAVAPPFNETSVGSTSPSVKFNSLAQSDGIASYGLASGFTEFGVTALGSLSANCATLQTYYVCQQTGMFSPKYPGLRTGLLSLTDKQSTPVISSLGLTGYGLAPQVGLAPGLMSTFAGSGTAGYTGDSGLPTAATLSGATSSAIDSAGNVYIADTANNAIRMVNAITGKISTVLSAAYAGATGAGATTAAVPLNGPKGIAVDAAGNLYIADTGNNVVREVNWGRGTVTTIAGTMGSSGSTGDGGLATSALLNAPVGLSFDQAGVLYVADTGNNEIRAINFATGTITTVAGNGTAGSIGDGAAANGAELNAPAGVFYEPPPAVQANSMTASQMAPQLLIADTANNKIRVVNLFTNSISTVAGTGTAGYTGDGAAATAATLTAPAGVVADAAGNIYIADKGNSVVREITSATGTIATVAGTGTSGYTGDSKESTLATLKTPTGVMVDGAGNLYITDSDANVVRASNVSTTLFDLGSQSIYGNSAAQILVVHNTGNQALVLGGLAFTGNFTQKATSGTDCTATSSIPAGASCNVGITFEPTSMGPSTGTLTLTDNTLNGSSVTQVVSLTGTGIAGQNAQISVASGSPQAVLINSPAAFALQVLVTDANSNPIASQTVTFTAPTTTTTANPSGTFTGGSASATAVTNAQGIATAPTFTANGVSGSYTVTATTPNATGTASFALQNVLHQYSTTTTLTANPASVTEIFGQPITLTAGVSSATAPSGTAAPTGNITFYDNSTAITVAVANSSASYTFGAPNTVPSTGTHVYSAQYVGDKNYSPSNSSTTTVTVQQATTTLSAAASVTAYVTAATVIPVNVMGQFSGAGIPTPTGSVTYSIGSGAPLSATITNGQAMLTVPTTVAQGSYTITANYAGDSNYTGSGTTIALTVVIVPTTTTVAVSPISPTPGKAATFTVTVQPKVSGPASPSGTVILWNETTGLALATLTLNSSGIATYSTSSLPQGVTNIQADYSGSTNFSPSASANTTVDVSSAIYQLTLAKSTLSVNQGSSVSTALTVAPLGSFAGTVAFSCTNLPTNATCSFDTADAVPAAPTGSPFPQNAVVFTGNGVPETLQMTVTTNEKNRSLGQLRANTSGWEEAALFAGLFLAGAWRRSRRKGYSLLLLLCGLLTFGSLVGCGGTNSNTPTPPGTYVVAVWGISSDTGNAVSVPLTVTVQAF